MCSQAMGRRRRHPHPRVRPPPRPHWRRGLVSVRWSHPMPSSLCRWSCPRRSRSPPPRPLRKHPLPSCRWQHRGLEGGESVRACRVVRRVGGGFADRRLVSCHRSVGRVRAIVERRSRVIPSGAVLGRHLVGGVGPLARVVDGRFLRCVLGVQRVERIRGVFVCAAVRRRSDVRTGRSLRPSLGVRRERGGRVIAPAGDHHPNYGDTKNADGNEMAIKCGHGTTKPPERSTRAGPPTSGLPALQSSRTALWVTSGVCSPKRAVSLPRRPRRLRWSRRPASCSSRPRSPPCRTRRLALPRRPRRRRSQSWCLEC